MNPSLRTDRLLLTPYTPADEKEFVALFQDASVSRWMGDGPSTEAEDRTLFGRIFTKVYAENRFEVWAVKVGGELVGHAEIKPTEACGGHEIIYALAPGAWGRGLGTEPAPALVGLPAPSGRHSPTRGRKSAPGAKGVRRNPVAVRVCTESVPPTTTYPSEQVRCRCGVPPRRPSAAGRS
ncbi:GNAT family N-acetyltransferase [Streptomyces cyaneofuscatus]|uniref:GNAT family N-acetyltransferase n=1 Tax=Streptomyces cyaneofuscatus TaxID=66883 RepID=UPI0037B81741